MSTPVAIPGREAGGVPQDATRAGPAVRAERRRASRIQGGLYHWDTYRMAEMLPPFEPGAEALLLGCGDGGERNELHRRGVRSLAFDIRPTPGADFLADAHGMPLPDATFDLVLSMQVLEHLHSPWVAAEEIARVLRPGGWFVGSVAFLKPYHHSYFHMSHQGVRQLLGAAGLRVDRLEAAQSITYSLYGGYIPFLSRPVKRALLGAVDRMIAGARARAWAWTRRADPDEPTDRYDEGLPMSFRQLDELRRAPAVVFRARKDG
jgi:SAM-dependent methyltransferase